MMSPDPRQFDMFATIDPAPKAVPMSPTSWETVAICERGPVTDQKVNASYSAGSLAASGKVLRPFSFRGCEWVNTGAAFHRGKADFECYRIVKSAAFAGPGEAATYHERTFLGAHRASHGGYHGMKAKLGSSDVVLIGPPVVFVLNPASVPA